MKARNLASIAALSALTLGLSACGGSNSPDTSGGSDDTGTGVETSITPDSTPKPDSKNDDTGSVDDTGTTKDSTAADSGSDTSIAETSGDTTTGDTGGDTIVVGDTGTDTTTADVADAGPVVAWGARCTATSNCAAPTGQLGYCATQYGTPVCTHECKGQDPYSTCEGGAGICIPTSTRSGSSSDQLCVKKCGDREAATCGAGAACAFLGYRAGTLADGGATVYQVGACVPMCSSTGADACAATGTSCDPARRACEPVGCPAPDNACPTGSSCVSGDSYCVAAASTALYGDCNDTTTTANGCISNVCFAAAGKPGFCSAFCNSETGTDTCGPSGVCWYESDVAYSAPADSGTIAYPTYPFSITGGRAAGACLKKCDDSAECPTGFYCAETNGKRACVPGVIPTVTPTAGTTLPGDVCHASGDCVSLSCGKSPNYVDGICLKASTTAVCPTGTVQNATNASECDKICDPTKDLSCAGSLVCVKGTGAAPSTCSLGICRENGDCVAPDRICDHASSTCVCKTVSATCTGAPPPGTGAIGADCTTNANCRGGVCIPHSTAPEAWAGGYCTSNCTVLPDLSDTCPDGTICTAARMGGAGVCLKLCDKGGLLGTYGSCKLGYTCASLGDPRVGYCVTM